MRRKTREFIEVPDYLSLDALIARLIEIRVGLPPEAEPELRLRGDDIFGRTIGISYFRRQTAEEAACDARYAETHRQSQSATYTEICQASAKSQAGILRSAA